MSSRTLLQRVDWPMWQILKREKGSGDAARFADRISDYAFFDGDVAPLDAGLLESRLPSAIGLPILVRKDTARWAAPFSEWLYDQDDEIADDALMACAFTSGAPALLLPDYLLLAYFSPAYRPIAVGIPGALNPGPQSYDGPEILPLAIAFSVDGEDIDNLLDPGAVADISRTIQDLDVTMGGKGDMGPLYDFAEDHMWPGLNIDIDVSVDLDLLQSIYAAASQSGHGVLVLES